MRRRRVPGEPPSSRVSLACHLGGEPSLRIKPASCEGILLPGKDVSMPGATLSMPPGVTDSSCSAPAEALQGLMFKSRFLLQSPQARPWRA